MGRLDKPIPHGAGQMGQKSPGSGKSRKNFEKDPRALLGKDEPRSAPRSCRQAKPPRNGN